MKKSILRHHKMVLLAVASLALLTSAVRAQTTVTPSLDDLILGFSATTNASQGATLNLEVDLGNMSNFYNAAAGSTFAIPQLALQDIVDTYGANWFSSSNVYWGAVATTGRASGTSDGHAPVGTLWATAPVGSPAFNAGSVFSQKASSPYIEAMITAGSAGTLYGATATSNSAFAAVINSTLIGSWSYQDTKVPGVSFGRFNPTVDGAVFIPNGGQTGLALFEMQPTNGTGVAGTYLGELVLSQSGLTFEAVPEPSTWVLVALGLGMAVMVRRSRKSVRA